MVRRQEPEEEPLEVRLARLEIELAEDTITLVKVAGEWGIDPEQAAQAVAESIRPGQTFGERVAEIYFYGAEE